MTCAEVRDHWELYIDSEGDSELYLAINEHLSHCADCDDWFDQQISFENAIAEKLAPEPANEALWDRVLDRAGVVTPTATSKWLFLGPVLTVAAAVLLICGIWQYQTQSERQHLSALAADVHRHLSNGAEPIEFVSFSDEDVERYLRKRVTFPVRCPPREDAGFIVRGGGVCSIGGKTAAYVHGNVVGDAVSVFILPDERLVDFAHEREALQRELVHHCREAEFDMVVSKVDRNVVVVIGRIQPGQLERVVRAYGTYPEPVEEGASKDRTQGFSLPVSPRSV